MPQIHRALFIVALFLTGCTTTKPLNLAEDRPEDTTQIQLRLEQILDAASKKDFPRLDSYHLYGLKFTKFTSGTSGRLDAEAARKGEHDSLGAATDMKMKADDLKIDVFGDVGIATFVLNYSFKGATGTVEKQALSTLVFVKDHGEWKITHEHLSAPKSN
jgi:ketosteroid isomerase-like protein